MNIKVCGITQMKQLQQLDKLNFEFAGLNFYKGSARYIGNKITSKELLSADLDIKIVGVFVDQSFDEIMEIADEFNLETIQLHGNESPALCESLSEELEVIKVFRIGSDGSESVDDLIKDYDEVCDYYLFDTAAPTRSNEDADLIESFGGTGLKFDWKKVLKSRIEKPFFLSGGIGAEDVAALKAFKHPDFFGADVNSKFETEPGIKDLAQLLKFKMDLK
jgi:phosphoribosylanthranilate isomerase